MLWSSLIIGVCSCLQTIAAILVLTFGYVSVVYHSWAHWTYHGVWAGSFMLLVGLVGLVSACVRSWKLQFFFLFASVLTSMTVWMAALHFSILGLQFDRVAAFGALFEIDRIVTVECPLAYSNVTYRGQQYEVRKCPNGPAVSANGTIIGVLACLLFMNIFIVSYLSISVAAWREEMKARKEEGDGNNITATSEETHK